MLACYLCPSCYNEPGLSAETLVQSEGAINDLFMSVPLQELQARAIGWSTGFQSPWDFYQVLIWTPTLPETRRHLYQLLIPGGKRPGC